MKMEEPKDLLPCTLDLAANYPQFLSSPEDLYDLERDVLDGYIFGCCFYIVCPGSCDALHLCIISLSISWIQ